MPSVDIQFFLSPEASFLGRRFPLIVYDFYEKNYYSSFIPSLPLIQSRVLSLLDIGKNY